MIVAATGHRPNKLNNEYNHDGPCSSFLRAKTTEVLRSLSVTEAISGMALGYDTIFALAALELGLPLIAAVPFVGQESLWPAQSQAQYKRILNNPLTTVKIISSGGYSARKMQIRNRYMVDSCDVLVACFDGSDGGTKNTMIYAEGIGRRVIRIDPSGWNVL